MKKSLKGVLILCICFFIVQKSNAQNQKHPSESIKYLIGTWELDFGKGIAIMEFKWGENKTYVTCEGKNLRNGKLYPEFFSLIFWDGVQEKFSISSAYTGEGDLLSEIGTMTISDTLISRDFIVNYAEGEKMPFLNQTAGEGGFTMSYRQRWKIKGADNMQDYFEIKIDGVWKNPFEKKEGNSWWKKKE